MMLYAAVAPPRQVATLPTFNADVVGLPGLRSAPPPSLPPLPIATSPPASTVAPPLPLMAPPLPEDPPLDAPPLPEDPPLDAPPLPEDPPLDAPPLPPAGEPPELDEQAPAP